MLETHMKLCVTKPDFLEKKISTTKIEKRPKTGPFEDIENFCRIFTEFVL